MTEVDRGTIAVSSSYSDHSLLVRPEKRRSLCITFIGVFVVDAKVKVCAIAESADVDDLALQLKDTDTCPIKGDSCRFFL